MKEKVIMLGNEAIARGAYEAGVKVASSYPGTPSTEISESLAKYLHGEEIETDCANGWAVVTVDGCAVGGAKVVNGTAKNHYPKGLRTKL